MTRAAELETMAIDRLRESWLVAHPDAARDIRAELTPERSVLLVDGSRVVAELPASALDGKVAQLAALFRPNLQESTGIKPVPVEDVGALFRSLVSGESLARLALLALSVAVLVVIGFAIDRWFVIAVPVILVGATAYIVWNSIKERRQR